MGPARLLHVIAERLSSAGVASATAEAGLLLEKASGLGRLELLTRAEPLTGGQLEELERMVARREQREPLQYILGVAHFHGLELQVSAGVLIPRPETEMLVELALERLQGLHSPLAVDVGTGTGAIALAIKQARPDARVVASDISEGALALASRNAESLGLEVRFVQADLLTGLGEAAEADIVVSNPPYLPDADRAGLSPEVRRDPELALFAGADGLDIQRRLLSQAESLLKPAAWLLLELDPRNVQVARAEASVELWSERLVSADLAGRERFLSLRRRA